MTKEEVKANFYGAMISHIRRLQKNIQLHRDEVDQRIYQLYKNGMKVDDIVAETNYSKSTIYRVIHIVREEMKDE